MDEEYYNLQKEYNILEYENIQLKRKIEDLEEVIRRLETSGKGGW